MQSEIMVGTTIGDGRHLKRWVVDKRNISDTILISVDLNRYFVDIKYLNGTLTKFFRLGDEAINFNIKNKNKVSLFGNSIMKGISEVISTFIKMKYYILLFMDSDVFINSNYEKFINEILELSEKDIIIGFWIPVVPRDKYSELEGLSGEQLKLKVLKYKMYFPNSTNFAIPKTFAKDLLNEINNVLINEYNIVFPGFKLWDIIQNKLKVKTKFIKLDSISHIVYGVELV